MRVVLIIAALLLVAVSAAAVVPVAMVPVAEPFRQDLAPVTLALAILVLIAAFLQPDAEGALRRRPRPNRRARRRNGLKRAVRTLKSSSSFRCSRKRVGWSIS